MPETKELGRLFVHRMDWATNTRPPLAELGTTHEIEPPWRVGRCLTVRVPFRLTGGALGVWLGHGSEQNNLREALAGSDLAVDAATIEQWDGDSAAWSTDVQA